MALRLDAPACCDCIGAIHPHYGYVEPDCRDHFALNETDWCYVAPGAICDPLAEESFAIPGLAWRNCSGSHSVSRAQRLSVDSSLLGIAMVNILSLIFQCLMSQYWVS
eukprot:gnl/TRDRNA2_/TRDRNA2_161370_c0_seq2.p2 gnl/TRDRNA2_/TRDRNA2_161370_c0~~gnl/TRDRNA2_/TRDRNA2_161370_c0_seq2.p2  ORF type:complete len:108 (-),score=5.36 gnl/TRDRNA2_/TRDRNA2_161370_c0_seq2:191-514(-)